MLILSAMPMQWAVVRLDPSSSIPQWAAQGNDFFSITKTAEELSIVCVEENVPSGVKVEKGWKCFKLKGPFDFGTTGVLSSVIEPLGKAKIGIFAISTFDTDYVLVKKENFEKAIAVLEKFCKIVD